MSLRAAVLLTWVVMGIGPVMAQQPAAQPVEQPASTDPQRGYLATNAKAKGVTVLPSGVQYRVLKQGKPGGVSPRPIDRVRVHYEGRLIDGTVFDSSYQRDETAVFGLNKLIKAWQETIPLMKVGDKIEMVVPSELGYGQRGAANGLIPPGATLIFTIELFEVLPPG